MNENEILYLRYPYPLFFFTSCIVKNNIKCKIVTEHNTIEPKEFLLGKGYLQFLIDLFFGKKLRALSGGFVGVTDEITNYQISRVGNKLIPSITNGNGFDVNSVAIKQHRPVLDDELHILFIGSTIHRWHGIDRFIRGINDYTGEVKLHFHIVGNCLDRQYYEKLNKNKKQKNIFFHGFLTGAPLDALFDQCHVAVGSLGIHRKGLTQTSELKAREYCARGIPYIIAVSDPDFPQDFPYILRLPADESPIDIEQVIAFAKEVCANSDHPKMMRRYAEEHLDWSVKMMRLKEFLEDIVRENICEMSD